MEGLGCGDGSANLGDVEGEDEEGGELGGEGLGAGDSDLGACVGGDGALGFAGDGCSDDVADGEGFGAFGDEFALGGDGVCGFAGLGDEEADGAGVGDGVAVTVLAGVVDLDWETGEALDHELAGEASVPGGSAGGDGDLAGVAEVFFGDLHLCEVDFAGGEGDAAEGGVADGAGLLVDFLEHEVLVAGLLGHDGVPGDALGLEWDGSAVEVGKGDAGASEDGDFAVGEEVDVAGVMEDSWDVGGEEVLALADADDGGWTHAGGDELVGLVGGEDADGEGSGEVFDGAADGFFEGDGGSRGFGVAVRGTCGGGGVDQLLLDQMGDDFGVGLGDELVAGGGELFFEGDVVLDDAVVDDDEGAGAVAVGVGVLFRRATVGGPASVADAKGAVDGGVVEDGFEVAELAGGSAKLHAVGTAGDGDSG